MLLSWCKEQPALTTTDVDGPTEGVEYICMERRPVEDGQIHVMGTGEMQNILSECLPLNNFFLYIALCWFLIAINNVVKYLNIWQPNVIDKNINHLITVKYF